MKQDYKNIIEWIIVDTSLNSANPTETLENIVNDFQLSSIKIIYYKSTKKTLGAWRNESNKLVSGDIIVCMDDDDYYPVQRVSHAVESLVESKKLMAGCDKMFFYDIHYKKFYQFNGFGQNHSTNNCMAYRKEYLKNHSYDENMVYSEETPFTNNFTEPIVQLDPFKTVMLFSHDTNTFNKKKIIYQNYFLEPDKKYISEINMDPKGFINDIEIYNEYESIFKQLLEPKESEYDIVYVLGAFSLNWTPTQKNLGGSEQSVKFLATEFANRGKKVAVYGNFELETNFAGVRYINFFKFRFWDKYKTLILWRVDGSYPYLEFDLKADKLLIDIHDHTVEFYGLLLKNKNKITNWMIKSEFQKNLIEQILSQNISNIVVIPNGVMVEEFSKQFDNVRNPYRMCYCSCYTRGLHRILENIWPIIYKLEPRAELHTYYGMDLVPNENFKTEMKKLLSQPGVMDHGRQPVEMVSREKHMSTFQFYYTDTLSEIDCISIKESLVAGCIPIISNINLFKYRDGIQIQWFPNTPDFNYQIACALVELMNNQSLQNELREKYYQSKSIITWKNVADSWMKYI